MQLNPELETSRLILEALTENQAPVLYEPLQNSELYRYIPQEKPKSKEALQEIYRIRSGRSSPDGKEIWLNWAVRLKEADQYLGLVQATVKEDKTALVAYFVFPAYQKCGYGKEATGCAIDYLFTELKVTSVTAEIDSRNTASIRLVEALSFECIGLTKRADFFKGQWSDEFRYCLRRD